MTRRIAEPTDKPTANTNIAADPATKYRCSLAEFLDKDGVAALLNISRRSVDAMLARGELPHIRLSKRCIRFPKAALLDALNHRVIGNTRAPACPLA
jgi:excisionase family DNA binding protein